MLIMVIFSSGYSYFWVPKCKSGGRVMNENWEKNSDEMESWQEAPYVSKFTSEVMKEMAAPDLASRVATKSFAIVFIGLIITTIASYLTLSNVDFLYMLLSTNMFTFLLVAELVVVFINSWAIRKNNLVLAGVLYLVYSVSNGITMSVVFLAYDLGTVQEAFLMSAVIFGAMAAFGYFTKKDLSTVGAVCGMALLGVLLVTLLNTFVFHSSGLELVMDYVVILLFVGITAYDMYRMKQAVLEGGEEEENRIALFTGMQLYLDFINIFLRLIRILGRSKK